MRDFSALLERIRLVRAARHGFVRAWRMAALEAILLGGNVLDRIVADIEEVGVFPSVEAAAARRPQYRPRRPDRFSGFDNLYRSRGKDDEPQ